MVAFSAVILGWALSLDYSAKLFTMTFVLVIMGSERASGGHTSLLCSSCNATAYRMLCVHLAYSMLGLDIKHSIASCL